MIERRLEMLGFQNERLELVWVPRRRRHAKFGSLEPFECRVSSFLERVVDGKIWGEILF